MLTEGQSFEKISTLTPGEYEDCQFKSCNFEGFDFQSFKFINCLFDTCNLSLVQTDNLGLQDCVFAHCKMLGFQFVKANTFNLSFSFNNCILDHSSFHGLKIKKTTFIDCFMKEVDFQESDCSYSMFNNCNLERTVFHHTNLEQANFLTSYHYVLDPEINKLKGAKFAKDGLAGLLQKYKIKIID